MTVPNLFGPLTGTPPIKVDANKLDANFAAITGGTVPLYVTATGSIAPRTLANRFADAANLKDFGAVGDGVTDDTAACAAWAARYALGYALVAPPGTYRTAAEIVVLPPPGQSGVDLFNQPSIVLDQKAVFQASAVMTAVMTLGSVNVDFSGRMENGHIMGGVFDCNYLAGIGLRSMFHTQMVFENVNARNATVANLKLGDDASPTASAEGIVINSIVERDLQGTTITAITKANPGVVTTATPHGYSNGQIVYLTSISGMTEANSQYVTVTVVSPTSFSIGVNTSGYTTYTSGGISYLTVNGTGVRGIYFQNCGDNHVHNCTIKGTEKSIGGDTLAGTLGIYDGKYSSVHCWNYPESGRILYGFDLGGDSSMVNCQVDGPFSYGYRFTGPRNTMLGCHTVGVAPTSGGRDGTDYCIKLETGGGVTAFGCGWKADPSARFAGVVTGDITNFSTVNQTEVNLLSAARNTVVRADANATVLRTFENLHAGASANAIDEIITNAGTLYRYALSTAGGGTASDDWSGAGDRFWDAGSAGASHRIRYGYGERITVGQYIKLSNLPTSAAGLPSGALWSNANVITIVP